MRWKSDAIIDRHDGMWLRRGNLSRLVNKDDEQIALLIDQGHTEDELLTRKVMDLEDGDENEAGLRLAQFALDYGDFLEEAVRSRVIEA